MGFACILAIEKSYQDVAGSFLALLLVIITAWRRPSRRESDTRMQLLCYTSILGFFILYGDPEFEYMDQCTAICVVIPALAFSYYVFKAYISPFRKHLWLKESV